MFVNQFRHRHLRRGREIRWAQILALRSFSMESAYMPSSSTNVKNYSESLLLTPKFPVSESLNTSKTHVQSTSRPNKNCSVMMGFWPCRLIILFRRSLRQERTRPSRVQSHIECSKLDASYPAVAITRRLSKKNQCDPLIQGPGLPRLEQQPYCPCALYFASVAALAGRHQDSLPRLPLDGLAQSIGEVAVGRAPAELWSSVWIQSRTFSLVP